MRWGEALAVDSQICHKQIGCITQFRREFDALQISSLLCRLSAFGDINWFLSELFSRHWRNAICFLCTRLFIDELAPTARFTKCRNQWRPGDPLCNALYFMDRKHGAPWLAVSAFMATHVIVMCFASSIPLLNTLLKIWRFFINLPFTFNRLNRPDCHCVIWSIFKKMDSFFWTALEYLYNVICYFRGVRICWKKVAR